MSRITEEAAERASELLDSVLGDPFVAGDLGTKFTCGEVESICEALSLLGRPEAAATLRDNHAEGDDEGDLHYRGP